MNWNTLIELIKVLAWPVVVLGALLAFRKPLATFVGGMGGRVTKLAAFNFSMELAALPPPQTPWSDASITQSAELASGDVTSTALMTLFNRPVPAE